MPPKRTVVHCCRECRNPLTAPRAGFPRRKLFCSIACKAAWQNRRNVRGRDLYDLFMSMRYHRQEAQEAGVWTEMCRLAEVWRNEDIAAGITSFDPPKVLIARLKDDGRLPRARAMRIR